MSQHLKFEASTGLVSTRSKFGEYTEELLQLNDSTQVEFRKTTLHALKITLKELVSLKGQEAQLTELFKQNKIVKKEYDIELEEINNDIKLTETLIQNFTGTKPPLSLKKNRFGVALS